MDQIQKVIYDTFETIIAKRSPLWSEYESDNKILADIQKCVNLMDWVIDHLIEKYGETLVLESLDMLGKVVNDKLYFQRKAIDHFIIGGTPPLKLLKAAEKTEGQLLNRDEIIRDLEIYINRIRKNKNLVDLLEFVQQCSYLEELGKLSAQHARSFKEFINSILVDMQLSDKQISQATLDGHLATQEWIDSLFE